MKTTDIVLIGGGPVAVSFLCQLNKSIGLKQKLNIIIFEKSSNYAAGYAYNNNNDKLLLNTPANTMSVLPDEPLRFCKWLDRNWVDNTSEFVPRAVFGKYLLSELELVLYQDNKLSVTIINESVINCVCNIDSCVISIPNQDIIAKNVIFCHGGVKLPIFKQFEKYDNYISDIYMNQGVLEKIRDKSRVLVLGTNLSMIDAILIIDQLKLNISVTAASRKAYFPCIKPANVDHSAGILMLRQTKDFINENNQLTASMLIDFLDFQFTCFLGNEYALEANAKSYNKEVRRYLVKNLLNEDYEANKLAQIYPYIDLCIDMVWPHLNDNEKQKFKYISRYLIRIIGGVNEVNFEKLKLIMNNTAPICLEKLLYIGVSKGNFKAYFASNKTLSRQYEYIIDCNGIQGYYHPDHNALLAKNILYNKQIKISDNHRIAIDNNAKVLSNDSVYSNVYALGVAGDSESFITNSFPFYVQQAIPVVNSICNRLNQRRSTLS